MSANNQKAVSEAITILPCGDNYIYIYRYDERSVFVVDPGAADGVLRTLAQQQLRLSTVLLTHHHGDHTGGIGALKKQTTCEIIGPDLSRIAGCDRCVGDGDIVPFGARRIRVLATPGHTRTSVSYYLEPSPGQCGCVWTGDTLFVGGCGRPMECDASVLWESLVRLAALPDDTLVYCGHDYTIENYEFALTIDPQDQAVQSRWAEIKEATSQGRPTVPSTIGREKATNIFLRSGNAKVQKAVDMSDAASEKVFAELRRRKNRFG